MPAKNPISKAIPELAATLALAPIATPPANVPFRTSFILNFPLMNTLTANAERQLPVKETIVFETIKVLWKSVSGKKAALKEGQNIQRNKVPIMAKVEFCLISSKGMFGYIFRVITNTKATPKKAP